MHQHMADVYGIAAHPARPFLYCSVSRDTTLRFWSLEGVAGSAKIRSVIDGGLRSCIGDASACFKAGFHDTLTPVLCGAASQTLSKELCDFRSHSRLVELYARLFDFFGGGDGMEELWSIVKTHAALEEGAAIPAGADLPNGLHVLSERVVHGNELVSKSRDLASRLEARGVFMIGDHRLKRVERLERAANHLLVSGDLRGYICIMVSLDRWEHALAMAPGVSMEFWRELADQYVEHLSHGEGMASSEAANVLPVRLASGRIKKALAWLVEQNDLLGGRTLARAVTEGSYMCAMERNDGEEGPAAPATAESKLASSSSSGGSKVGGGSDGRGAKHAPAGAKETNGGQAEWQDRALDALTQHLADKYAKCGEPILAAAAHLSIQKVSDAIQVLMQGNEVELCYAITQALRLGLDESDKVIAELARRSEAMDDFPLAAKLLEEMTRKGSPDDFITGEYAPQLLIARAAWRGGSEEAPAKLYERFSLRSPEQFSDDGEVHLRRGDHIAAIRCMVMAGKGERAVGFGLTHLRSCCEDLGCDSEVSRGFITNLLQLLSCVDATSLPTDLLEELLVYANYLGAIKAGTFGYTTILSRICDNAIELMNRVCKRQGKNAFPKEMTAGALGLMHARALLAAGQGARDVLIRLRDDKGLGPKDLEQA
ncbi:unnamed protein product [Chrysoparadoxa australica]